MSPDSGGGTPATAPDTSTRATLLTLAGLALLGVILFLPWITSGKSLYGSDFLLLNYPQMHVIREALQQGRLPLWTNRIFSGYPLFADPQVYLFYPPAWPLFLSPFEYTFGWYVLLHLVVAGAGAAFFFRRLGISPAGAFVGGASFMVGTSLPQHVYLGHLPHIQVIAWMPWVLYFAHDYFLGRRPRSLLLAAVATALSLLGGHPQMVFYTLLFLGWLALWAPPLGGVSRGRALLLSAAFVAGGFLLAGVSVIPTLELVSHSGRSSTIDDSFRAMGSLPLPQLLTLLLPDLFGSVPARSWWPDQPWYFRGAMSYHGLFPLVALFLAGDCRRRHPLLPFFFWPLLLSIVLALGSHTPLYRLILLLPGFNLFRTPRFILIIAALCLAGITAWGFSALESEPRSRRFLTGTAGAAALLLAAGVFLLLQPVPGTDLLASLWGQPLPSLPPTTPSPARTAALQCLLSGLVLVLMALALLPAARSARPRRWLALLAALILADSYIFSRSFIGGTDLDRRHPSRRLGPVIQELAAGSRVFQRTRRFEANEPLIGAWDGIGGNNTLVLTDYARLLTLLAREPWPNPNIVFTAFDDWSSPIARALNAGLILSYDVIPDPRLAFLTGLDQFLVYRNPAALDRATVYPSVRRLPREELIRAMGTFDPSEELLVEDTVPLPAPASGDTPVHRAQVVTRDDAHITVTDPLGRGGFLLLSQAWYPGWEARWEGGVLPVLKGDLALTVVPLPPGCRDVHLSFRPASLAWGAFASACGLILLIFLWRLPDGLLHVRHRRHLSL